MTSVVLIAYCSLTEFGGIIIIILYVVLNKFNCDVLNNFFATNLTLQKLQ